MPTTPATEQLPVRTAAVWAALDPLVEAGTPLRVLDVGGGSGMFAVPLARLGHDVTVVDPSADALATLRRRADTAGAGARVHGLQGDGDLLHEVLPAAGGHPRDTTWRCATTCWRSSTTRLPPSGRSPGRCGRAGR
ncbi:class I SAM-dependent methyltransferase [Blastococcus brunescens]|uniref:Class I SAM-dependent methyltransferase n=1 Tax=Blastococcus brunescens TaxID=1564165 RepID=A0ABZ1BA71_9ACTN|nr:class I SAM-dependent methyltransferase [Blastococcus sp. BMG 8361]WRL66070.1 class I SAM-dependent methyltransferase [Blastococcus sp. BMG 8361]